MTLQYRKSGVLLTNRITFPSQGDSGGVSGLPAFAFRGEVVAGGCTIDDPDGTLTIEGWEPFTVDDTDATPTRVWTGYIHDRQMGRGGKYTGTAGRVFDCDLRDLNSLLQLHVLRANAAKRGAETDVARVQWLLTSEALADLVYDEGLVGTASPIGFLESDTRRKFANAVLQEMAPTAGKNYFVYYDTTAARPALFYGSDTAAVWASTIAISNDPADVDNSTVFAPSQETTVERQPNEQYGGVSYASKNMVTYQQSATTIAAMALLRDAVVDTDRIGLRATLEAEAARYLNVHATESDYIRTTLRLTSADVNKVYAGQELDIKLTHLADYTAYVTTRVRRADKVPVSPGIWDVHLELWVPPTPGNDAAAPTGECDTDLLDGVTFTYDVVDNLTTGGTGGGPAINNIAGLNDGDQFSGAWMASGHVTAENGTLVYTFKSDLGSAQTVSSVTAGGYACGGWTFQVYHGASLGATTNLVASTVFPSSDLVSLEWDPVSARYWTFTMSHYHAGFSYLTGFGGSGDQGLNIFQLCNSGLETPIPFSGDQVDDGGSTPGVDGSTTTFFATDPNGVTTPYADGTLVVILDGIDIWEDVTESDPTTGEYELAFAPESDEQVRTRFVAR